MKPAEKLMCMKTLKSLKLRNLGVFISVNFKLVFFD